MAVFSLNNVTLFRLKTARYDKLMSFD